MGGLLQEQLSPSKPSVSDAHCARGKPWSLMPRGSASPALSSPSDALVRSLARHFKQDMLGLALTPSPPRDGSATTAKAQEPLPVLARGKMGSFRDLLFPLGALEGLGAEDPGILHPLCSQLVGLKQMSVGRGWEKAAQANDASWDRTRGILFSCDAAGRQEAPPPPLPMGHSPLLCGAQAGSDGRPPARPPHDQGPAAGTEPREVPAPLPARPKGD